MFAAEIRPHIPNNFPQLNMSLFNYTSNMIVMMTSLIFKSFCSADMYNFEHKAARPCKQACIVSIKVPFIELFKLNLNFELPLN